MPRLHGKDVRVYLGKRDVSADLASLDPQVSARVHDRTTFADGGWETSDPGLGAYEVAIEGFYDPALGGFGRQFEDLLGASGGVLTLVEAGTPAIGSDARCYPDSVLVQRGQPISVAELIKLTGRLVPASPSSGGSRPGVVGKLLKVLAATTLNGADQASSSVDNTASSANGGRANLHVTAIDAATTATVKVQHSADGSTWADLVTFTSVTATTSESKDVGGTVNRYLRALVNGTNAKSITHLVAFARYQGATYL